MAHVGQTTTSLTTHDGLRLDVEHHRLPDGAGPARGHAVLVHGFGEHRGRYRALVRALTDARLVCHLYDQRGHGTSEGQRGHVDRFASYRDDLGRVFERSGLTGPRPAGSPPRLLFGHSMGGLLALDYALQHPGRVDLLVLSSPFLGAGFWSPSWAMAMLRPLARLVPRLPVPSPLKISDLTRDEGEREAVRQDPLAFSRTTPRWVTEIWDTQEQVAGRVPELAAPTLVLLGSADPLADPDVTRRLFARFGTEDKTLLVYPGMLHEPLHEVGRDEVLRGLVGWVRERLG